MRTIIEANIPAVIGTTGLSANDIAAYKKQCDAQHQSIILAPNFSISVLLMMKYAEDAAKYFNEVEIIEMHHTKKLDAPSGTARKTARMIADKNEKFHQSVIENSPARGGIYDGNTIPIHSIRLSGKMAHQQVIFSAPGDTLTLQQDTISRECFMPGFLIACRAINTLNHFVEGLENILWPQTKL
jgi:4-hydroxy-tetrahydrodipicolinate reductase